MSEPTVKCLVWDLDDTLWRGVLLEDDTVTPFERVREVITTLDSRGILQSIASKNDHDHAWPRLEVLGLAEYFVLPHIGWGPKSASVRAIAEQLKFAHSTIVFVDDNPVERAEVAHHLPEVRCYDAVDVPGLVGLPEFSPAIVTVDSRQRRQMYRAGFAREASRADFTGPDDDFLRTLGLEMVIGRASEQELSRVEELTLRTSQMNATGVHYGDATLRGLLTDPGHEVLVVAMSDRFGPHGAVGIVLLERHAHVWHLKLLATSCRVVSLGAGSTLLNWLSDQAAAAGVHVVADFRRTDRNRIMEIAYRFAGFSESDCGCVHELVASGVEGVERLHLTPLRHPAPSTLQLSAPDLASVTLSS
ncbi:HAD-IIIC family phosphatase [Amycolatopsis sp. NPDC051061]|uniref:HAD-IIIC family phosphatase n=1 Tax=Amycolatopsis sp. NPDC051061 TaxID=3155042 RepID=UPI00341FB3D8